VTFPIPFCDTPGQSVAAALLGGVAGGLAGLALGLDAVGVAVLAGGLGGLGDLLVHVLRGDPQFLAATDRLPGR
jgi:hypothetical protein